MGQPGGSDPVTLSRGPTQGTETSKYLEEKKSTEIPRVAASEKGTAQTRAGRLVPGVVGPRRKASRSIAERYWNVRPQRVRVPYAKCE